MSCSFKLPYDPTVLLKNIINQHSCFVKLIFLFQKIYQRWTAITHEDLLRYLEDDIISDIDILAADDITSDVSKKSHKVIILRMSWINKFKTNFITELLRYKNWKRTMMKLAFQIQRGTRSQKKTLLNFTTVITWQKNKNIFWMKIAKYQTRAIKWNTFRRYCHRPAFAKTYFRTNGKYDCSLCTWERYSKISCYKYDEIKSFIGIHIVMGTFNSVECKCSRVLHVHL